MSRDSEYKPEYANKLVECLAQGMLDCEIYDALNVCKNTFIRWKKENEDFADAYELGLPKCEAWWVREMKKRWLDGNDKGFKYCALIMRTKFGYNEKTIQGITNNTQINIQNNQTLIKEKSRDELIEFLKDGLENHQIIDVEPIAIDHEDQSKPKE